MASGTFTLAANNDDGHCDHSGTNFSNSTGLHRLGKNSATSYRSYFRFTGVNIAAGSTITAAKVTFRATASRSGAPCNVRVHCEAADNPGQPSDGADVIGRSLTTGTNWDSVAAMTFGNYYDSVDFTSELQAVIDRVGWSSGNAVTVHFLDNGSGNNDHRLVGGPGYLAGYEADLVVEWDEETVGDVVDSFTVSDTVDAEIADVGDVVGAFTVQDVVDALLTDSPIADSFTVSDEIDAGLEADGAITDAFEVSDVIEGYKETDAAITDAFEVNDLIDAFNFSDWLRENKDKALQCFFFTLTGSADATTDVELPITNFYARKVNGNPTYLQVTIHGHEYAQQIADRLNGDMVLEMGYQVDGVVSLREEILTVDFDAIQMPKGGSSRSIVLTGYRTHTYAQNRITLLESDAEFQDVHDSNLLFRFAKIDPYINAGDICIVGSSEFTVNNVVYIVDANRATMQVQEGT